MSGMRLFHGSSPADSRTFEIRECMHPENCHGRMHFLAIGKDDLKALQAVIKKEREL